MKARLLPLSAALLLTTPGFAFAEERLEGLAGAALNLRHTTEIDLARVAGAEGYGAGSDTGPLALGLGLSGGLVTPFSLEIAASAWIAVGGLDLDRIERRYFDGPEGVGSSASVGAEGGVRFAPLIAPDLRLLVGPAAGGRTLVASSPAGSAWVNLMSFGLDTGARLHLNTISRVVDGHLELLLHARRDFPFQARVQRSHDDVLFDGRGGGASVYSFGASVGYVFAFHRRSVADRGQAR
jgi:hypothetical protein